MSLATASFEAAEEDQKRVLQEALGIVKRQAYFMKQAIDENNLEETLRTAVLLLRELRTGALSPSNYYELWIAVTGELRHLREYFVALNNQGKRFHTLHQRRPSREASVRVYELA
jgi:vacuolar protein sorting-associated protein 35